MEYIHIIVLVEKTDHNLNGATSITRSTLLRLMLFW